MNNSLDLSTFSLLDKYQQGGKNAVRHAHTANDKAILALKKGLNNYIYTEDGSLMYDNGDIDVNSEFSSGAMDALVRMRKYAERKYPDRFGKQAWTRDGVNGGPRFVPSSSKIYGLDYEIMNYLYDNGDIKRADNPRFEHVYLPSNHDLKRPDSRYEYMYTYDPHELSTNNLNDGDESVQERFQSRPIEWYREKGSDEWLPSVPNPNVQPRPKSTEQLKRIMY